ncbi:helix-turn-helix transcriptional regulator [Hoeflea prorocentri]|uniref:LuxR C-terminal-related transcriptional regulator n=1 Tax=Hoeflea prorocentri TaxID=1922333 RepID=A0A9X3ZI16_9HYPH|nr:LuxR family transcriptional regulator [Hoeflea prorocentri]MCY6381270.1 LuxR C-terminal-related transcriptional regulator [Hoeflea prorocentri]MDA5399070.1 LuxR C-terminal-related transcriptional regulator [Hoeflea prorocentri]
MDLTARNLTRDLVSQLDEQETELLSSLTVVGGADRAEPRRTCRRLVKKLPNCLRLDDDTGKIEFCSDDLRALFADVLSSRCRSDALAEAATLYAGGDVVSAIEAAQAAGDYAQALEWFREQGNQFFMHLHGLDSCLRIVSNFPEDMRRSNATLAVALAMHALKSGSVNRARHIVREHFGPEALDLERVAANPQLYSRDFRMFRLVMSIYEDYAIGNTVREHMFELLGELELDDHLNRGGIYNTMLEVCIQRQQLDAAEEMANRASHHYNKAGVPLLVFYIELHRAVFSLVRGVLPEVESAVRDADAALYQVTFETPTDHRLLGLIKAVLAYEKGNAEQLVTYLSEEFDKFAYGELWPTITELALYYGSLAISGELGIAAARTFLDKWRIQEWRSRRFNFVITIRQVDILQNHNRWQEAAELLTSVQSRINMTWVESAEEALELLDDTREIAIAFAWMRHLIRNAPRNAMRLRQVEHFRANPNVNDRQRSTLSLWLAYLARQQRDLTKARAQFTKVLDGAARMGAMTHLIGEKVIVDRLMEDKRISQFVRAAPGGTEVLRRLDVFHSGGRQREVSGLTRQELRVLTLVAEGASNKFVARQLRLSEVTVKFHLGNIYRKMGCTKRSEAISAARALNWVA